MNVNFSLPKEESQMADVFRLTKAVTGITFNAEGRGLLFSLPIDARLRLIGQSSTPGLIDVMYGATPYSVFKVDLIERSVTLRTIAAAA
jgi:hypothetical protein